MEDNGLFAVAFLLVVVLIGLGYGAWQEWRENRRWDQERRQDAETHTYDPWQHGGH